MADPTGSASFNDRSVLIQFGSSCLELLMLDDLWTKAVESNDPDAVNIGRRMQRLIGDLREGRSVAANIIGQGRAVLNAAWPSLRERWNLSLDASRVLEAYFAEYRGGFGDAGAAIAADLDVGLEDELTLLSSKIEELEELGESTGDLRLRQKIALGIVGACALVVLPLLGAGAVIAGAATVGVAIFTVGVAEAGIGASIAATFLGAPEPPGMPPAPSAPA